MKQSRWAVVHASVIDADISDAAFRLYARLASYADRDGICWPGVAALAELAAVQPRQIRKLLTELREAGLVERVPRFRGDGSQTSSVTYLPVIGDQAGVSSDDSGAWAARTGLEQPIEQPKRTTQNPSGSGSAEGDDVVRSVRDDDQEMPEYGNETKRKKKPKGEAPPPGTSARLVWKFREECKRLRVYRFNISHLNRLTDSLREEEEKLSNEEIEIVIDVFFARYGEDVRHKREIDPVRMFHQQINSGLVRQCDDLIAKHRRGGYDKPKTKNKYAEMWREQYG